MTMCDAFIKELTHMHLAIDLSLNDINGDSTSDDPNDENE